MQFIYLGKKVWGDWVHAIFQFMIKHGSFWMTCKKQNITPLDFRRHPKNKPLHLPTLCDDVQHNSKRCQSSYHVEQSHSILDRKTLIPSSEVKETDEQWHQQGFQTMNHQRHQVPVVVKYLPPIKKTGKQLSGDTLS